jgi:ribosomal protein S19E (S16A)
MPDDEYDEAELSVLDEVRRTGRIANAPPAVERHELAWLSHRGWIEEREEGGWRLTASGQVRWQKLVDWTGEE